MLKELGIEVARRVYTYNVFGHMTRQKDSNASLDGMQDTWFNGYDEMGNLTGYAVVSAADGKNKDIYHIDYAYRDSYKELKTTLAKDGSVVESSYDVNGNRISILETKPAKTTTRNRLWYDADGHVQSYKKDGKDAAFNLIVNGNVLGEESASADNLLGSNYMPVTSPSMVAAPSAYSVQSANETLQSIAQGLWGDGNLWYLIADANALTADSKLTVGDILRIPARVNTVHGDYDTYKPYDPSEQIGSTAPTMPPPKAKGCGGLGMIVMIVVAVVASIYTAGLAAQAFGVVSSTTGAFSAGLGVIGGEFGLGVGVIGAGAVGGAVGSIASQAVGIAIGAQDGFDWKGVAKSALAGGVSAGVAGQFGKVNEIADLMSRAAVSNALTQGVSIVTGLQNGFSWKGVAASAAGAWAGAKVGQALESNHIFENVLSGKALEVARATTSGFVAGTTAAIARGGKIEVARIVTDAFGNALGSSVAEAFDPDPLGTFIDRNASSWSQVSVGNAGMSEEEYWANPAKTTATRYAEEYGMDVSDVRYLSKREISAINSHVKEFLGSEDRTTGERYGDIIAGNLKLKGLWNATDSDINNNSILTQASGLLAMAATYNVDANARRFIDMSLGSFDEGFRQEYLGAKSYLAGLGKELGGTYSENGITAKYFNSYKGDDQKLLFVENYNSDMNYRGFYDNLFGVNSTLSERVKAGLPSLIPGAILVAASAVTRYSAAVSPASRGMSDLASKPIVITKPASPGDPDFIGPVRLSLYGDDDFVGPPPAASISANTYARLRRQTPTQQIRDMVNPEGPLLDPVYGYHVQRLEADHIVSMKSIAQMPYFDKIGEGHQLEVLNLQENFMGLGKSTNTSMGAKSWSEWNGHSRLGPVPSDFRADMIQREAALRRILQSKINDGVRNGK